MDKILVIGLGSMGRRRIRLIENYFQGWELHGVDSNPERRKQSEMELGIKTWESIDSAIAEVNYKCAFVCTSPASHYLLIEKCLYNNLNVFTEINLIDKGYKKNIELARERNLLLFLSSTMIYKDEMVYLKDNLEEKKYMYTYHVGQYLPDWHPWESYKDFFVGNKETNGCREILAIEMPWIVHIFGEIESVTYSKSRITELDIEFEDVYMLIINHKNGTIGSLIVDVVACEPVRDLRIIGENSYIEWNGEPGIFRVKKSSNEELKEVKIYDKVKHQEGYNNTITENEYINELEQFFSELNGTRECVYGFEDDIKILKIINEVEGI